MKIEDSHKKKLIVNYTPTGMVPTKEDTPHVPITPEEIIEDVQQAYKLGITSVHLHARDPDTGRPTWRKNVYGEIIEGIREFAPELVICASLSGRDWSEFEKRIDVLQLEGYRKPDMGSLTLGSQNFSNESSVNSPSMIKKLASEMNKKQIKPELEAFSPGMINYSKYLCKKGFIKSPFYFNLIFGNIATAQAYLSQMGLMVRDLPDGSVWSFGGIGASQLPANTIAIASGGGVRVGIEDNIWYDRNRTNLASNLELIERIHKIAKIHNRSVMDPLSLRKKLNLKLGDSQYGKIKQ